MNGLWLEQRRLSFRADLPQPAPAAGEALIRVRLAGICATDLQLLKGYYPFNGIPGHEFTGEVIAAPEHPELEGARVAGEINLSCGVCGLCRAERTRHCLNRRVLGIKNHHGAFAEYLTLPVQNLHPVPLCVPDGQAVFTEPLAAVLRVQEQVRFESGAPVLVVGAGRLGLLLAYTLALSGYAVSAVARHPRSRELLARQNIVCLDETNIKPRSFNYVADTGGSPGSFALARQAVMPGGTLILKSTYRGLGETDLSALAVDEITLIGSRCGSFTQALALLGSGRLDLSGLTDAEYPLTEGLQAFQRAADKGALKVLLRPG